MASRLATGGPFLTPNKSPCIYTGATARGTPFDLSCLMLAGFYVGKRLDLFTGSVQKPEFLPLPLLIDSAEKRAEKRSEAVDLRAYLAPRHNSWALLQS